MPSQPAAFGPDSTALEDDVVTVLTHLTLGSKIYEAVSAVLEPAVDRRWFLYGNIYPDLSHYVFSAPHFAKYSMDFVRQRIAELCDEPLPGEGADAFFSMQLGALCHYLCDFFCHVHSEAFRGGILRHLDYELRQQALVVRHPRLIGRRTTAFLAPGAPLCGSAPSLCDALDAAQAAYLASPHRPDTDLVLAVKFCSMAVASILAICAENSPVVAPMPA